MNLLAFGLSVAVLLFGLVLTRPGGRASLTFRGLVGSSPLMDG